MKEDKYKNLERVNFWTANCDSKVSYLLTLQGIILTIIFTSDYANRILVTLSYRWGIDECKAFLRFLEEVSLFVFLILILFSLYNAYLTLRARIDPKVFEEKGLTTESVLFFGGIAEKSFEDFQTNQNNTLNDESLLQNDIDSQIFINSKICQLKFKYYNLTLKHCKNAVIAGLIYLIIVIINGI